MSFCFYGHEVIYPPHNSALFSKVFSSLGHGKECISSAQAFSTSSYTSDTSMAETDIFILALHKQAWCSYWSYRWPKTSLFQWAGVLTNCVLWMLGKAPQSQSWQTGAIGKSLLSCRLADVQGSEGHCAFTALLRHHLEGCRGFSGMDIDPFPTSSCSWLSCLFQWQSDDGLRWHLQWYSC